MDFKELQQWLTANKAFAKKVNQVRARHVASQFGMSLTSIEKPDWSYLMLCASVLAPDSEGTSQDMALRLAQACLEDGTSSEEQRSSAFAVLHSLINQPSMSLAKDRNLVPTDIEDLVPVPLKEDWMRRKFESTRVSKTGHSAMLNRLQQAIAAYSTSADWLSISAPTSAGKSYGLLTFLEDAISSGEQAAVAYIVPTRALVSQVATDVQVALSGVDARLVTLPWSEVDLNKRTLFVLTQERLHVLLNRFPKLVLHSIIVDEAQKVGDNTRGILLQQAVAKCLNRNPRLKVLFAMPLAENPETLLDDSPTNVTGVVIARDERTVNQNLLWAQQQPRRSDHWTLHLMDEFQQELLGEFQLPSKPSPPGKRLPFVAYALGEKSGGNLLYANTAAMAEKMAMQLYDLRSGQQCNPSQGILDLIDLVKRTVHDKYSLATVLEREIGFHYGSMPQLIRKTLEDLFRAGEIRYMVCTSTLIEGVNLACKSIYVKGPTKGTGTPMTQGDFWNMGGRAGRWGKEFQGNVVCVDPEDHTAWKGTAPRSRRKFVITRSIDRTIQQPQRLLDFIGSDPSEGASSPESDLTYTTSFLTSSLLESGSLIEAPWTAKFDQRIVKDLEQALSAMLERIELPSDLIVRNPGVSIFGMHRLKSYFDARETSGEKQTTDLLLADPGSTDAVTRYTSALSRLNTSFGDLFGTSKRCYMLALLMRDWMQGHQLARIIDNRQKRYPDLKLANVIRDCMRDVEEYARFRGPKYLKVYNDVLKLHLTESGRTDLLDEVADYEFQLELGVSQQTQLSLIALGLSRSTAISLSELIARDDLSENDCREWLQSNQWMVESIPATAQNEIRVLIESRVL
jgi:hypothetical protein